MPIYEYRCDKCGHEDESIFPIARARKSIRCRGCGGRAIRVYSTPAIHFKGNGFYNTDYKNKSAKDKPKDEKPPQEVKKDADKKGSKDGSP
jgi:putative FmdB family regulatory protein